MEEVLLDEALKALLLPPSRDVAELKNAGGDHLLRPAVVVVVFRFGDKDFSGLPGRLLPPPPPLFWSLFFGPYNGPMVAEKSQENEEVKLT